MSCRRNQSPQSVTELANSPQRWARLNSRTKSQADRCLLKRSYEVAFECEERRDQQRPSSICANDQIHTLSANHSRVHNLTLTNEWIRVGNTQIVLGRPIEDIVASLGRLTHHRFGRGTAWDIVEFETSLVAQLQNLHPNCRVEPHKISVHHAPTDSTDCFARFPNTKSQPQPKSIAVVYLTNLFEGGALDFPDIECQYVPEPHKHNTIYCTADLQHAVMHRVTAGICVTVMFTVTDLQISRCVDGPKASSNVGQKKSKSILVNETSNNVNPIT